MITFSTPVENLTSVGKTTASRLQRIGINNANDLLWNIPRTHEDLSQVIPIEDLEPGHKVSIKAKIEMIRTIRSPRKRMFISEALVSDKTGEMKIIWFNQPYISKTLKTGDEVYFVGEIMSNNLLEIQLTNPTHEKVTSDTTHTARIVPLYHLTAGLTQKQLRFLIKQVLPLAQKTIDYLPDFIKKEYKLINLPQALNDIHFPKKLSDFETARNRLKFDELLMIMLSVQESKNKLKENNSPKINFQEKIIKDFVANLPFTLTDDQKKTAWEILLDLEKEKPMNRLLEGDVGSGKTIVAGIALLNASIQGLQTVLLAPTEILAKQHFSTFQKLFTNNPLSIALFTRTDKKIIFPPDKGGSRGVNKYIPYNKKLTKMAQNNRKNPSAAEKKFWLNVLHQEGINKYKFIRQKPIDNFILDFYCSELMLAIEIDGDTHAVKDKYDKDRTKILNNLGIKVIRYFNNDVFNNTEGVLNDLIKKIGKINKTHPNPPLSGREPKTITKKKLINEIKNNNTNLIIGTHALLQEAVEFTDLAFIVIDEQHRFGVNQRQKLKDTTPNLIPHFLSMTATPIPRSLALTLYGDLDISLIKQKPANRKPIITKLITNSERQSAYDFIKDEVKKDNQIFVICPLIDESDKLGVKSVTQEHENLSKNIFPDLKIGIVHGKLKKDAKEKVMDDFRNKKINILVATAVVEVGVDIPDATIMMIEGADRFGLAQLHQFRGRVGRSDKQSYCLLFTESNAPQTLERLDALVKNNNGFELAEKDLQFRGPGDVYGFKQSGLPELQIASLNDVEYMKKTKDAASKLLKNYPNLKGLESLKTKLDLTQKPVHFE